MAADGDATSELQATEMASVRIPDRADAPVSEITERFFRAIVAKVPVDRIEELHLFAPLRQSGVETGIAVIAARVIVPVAPTVEPAAAAPELQLAANDHVDATTGDADADPAGDVPTTLAMIDSADAGSPVMVERHTVYTARYRLVQKGAERGKWEASVVDEADAPLITVEMVVRGVQRRAGEASDTTRYTGSQIARALRL